MEGPKGNQRAVQEIARRVLDHDPAVRLPTAQELQQSVGVGAGTVQKAFALLEEAAALRTRSRGHQGRFIVRRDLGRLWTLAGLPSVEAVMTPPGALEVYGLSEALEKEFALLGVPLDVRYIRGASSRLEHTRATPMGFSVLSAGAARAYASDATEFTTYPLGEGSYYARDSIVEISRTSTDPADSATRIGVDRTSFDHTTLSGAQFGPLEGRKTVDVAFTTAPVALLRSEIDVAIWHRMLLLITPEMAGLSVRPLSPQALESLAPLAQAVFVARKDNPYMRTVFAALSSTRLTTTQREVMQRISLDDGSTWYR